MLIYDKYPEIYDKRAIMGWDFIEINLVRLFPLKIKLINLEIKKLKSMVY